MTVDREEFKKNLIEYLDTLSEREKGEFYVKMWNELPWYSKLKGYLNLKIGTLLKLSNIRKNMRYQGRND